MPITALVVTLKPTANGATLAHLGNDPRIEVGPAQGSHWPLVVETASAHEGRSVAESLEALSEVVRVDLVSVNFEDLQG